MKWPVTIVGLVLVGLTCPTPARAADEKTDAKIAELKKAAEETWKKLLAGKPFNHAETDNFLFYSSLDDKDVETLSKAAEKTVATVKKTAAFTAKDELWAGKLVVYAFKERGEFTVFLRNFEKRSVEKDDTGTFAHKPDGSYITAGPAAGGRTGSLETEIVRQVAAATITKKNASLPEWFVSGFARSTAYRHAPAVFADERKKAQQLVQMGKTARDVWGAKLSLEDARVLNASLVDFLANGPGAKYFPEILNSMGGETPFEDALKSAKVTGDQVDQGWRRWVFTIR